MYSEPFVLFLPRVMSSPAKVGLHVPLMYHTPCAAALNSYASAVAATDNSSRQDANMGCWSLLGSDDQTTERNMASSEQPRYGRSSRDDNFFFPAPHGLSGELLAVIKLMFLWGRPETRLLHFTARHQPNDAKV